jgi:NAD(P)-dependent dehydrogenase (short-subunit alcohol dehydrogenase family)
MGICTLYPLPEASIFPIVFKRRYPLPLIITPFLYMKRTILITGSAKGLGAALGIALAKDGHRIALHYCSSRNEAEEKMQAIRNSGGDCAAFQSPLTNLSDGEKLIDQVATHFGALDTLINNAGVFNRKRFEELTQEEWETGFASTAGAAFYATRAALPHLRKSGHGRIINIGDALSDHVGFTEPAMSYYIGKVGVWMMTQTLAHTEAPHKVTVNMISPGVLPGSICDTPVEEMPMGRHGTYDDVIHPIRFLLEETSEAITGSNFHVSGGWNTAPFFPTVLKRAGYTKLPPGGTK